MISGRQKVCKRIFDVVLSLLLILILWPIILVVIILAAIDTHSFGLFLQKRVGQEAKLFTIIKAKTMREPKKTISAIGDFLRNSKLDELPQLFNIFAGQMSFVGPRPDLPGFADKLQGEDRVILFVKPGLTSPAAIKYSKEEQLLAQQDDPEEYNRDVIWKDKVAMNVDYVRNWTFEKDIKCLLKTLKLIK